MFGFSLVGLDIKDAGVDQLKEPEGGPTVARSKLYGLLASAFNTPSEAEFNEIKSGGFSKKLDEASEELPYEIDVGLEPLPDEWSSADLHSEFLNLFEVGAGGPPCPLFGGVWAGDRMAVIEEVVRFYNYFGLKSSEERRIPPDHLATELEFLHYLTYREAASPMETLAVPYRHAQLDFIERQPGRWLPKFSEKLAKLGPARYFTSLVALVSKLLESDRNLLKQEAG